MDTASGYVLVQTTSPRVAARVAADAGALPGVADAVVVQGAFDVVLRVPHGTLGLLDAVRSLPEVIRALPLKRRAGASVIAGVA